MFGRFLFVVVSSLLVAACSDNGIESPHTARDYLQQGFRYKGVGWCEKARFSLLKAIELDKNSLEGKTAALYLRARIPKFPVSEAAETANINAFNLAAVGQKDAACSAFKLLTSEYPDFEWPYGNLAAIYIEQGKFTEAVSLLKKVLSRNSDYFNGWKHLAEAYHGLGNEVEAKKCKERALEILPQEYQDAGY